MNKSFIYLLIAIVLIIITITVWFSSPITIFTSLGALLMIYLWQQAKNKEQKELKDEQKDIKEIQDRAYAEWLQKEQNKK